MTRVLPLFVKSSSRTASWDFPKAFAFISHIFLDKSPRRAVNGFPSVKASHWCKGHIVHTLLSHTVQQSPGYHLIETWGGGGGCFFSLAKDFGVAVFLFLERTHYFPSRTAVEPPLINYPRNSMDLQETAYFIPLLAAAAKENTRFYLSAQSGALSVRPWMGSDGVGGLRRRSSKYPIVL